MDARRVVRFVGLALVAAAVPTLLVAQAPVVAPGECLYLVGAPPGAPAAATEETSSGVEPASCQFHVGQVDLNRDGANMVQSWIVPTTAPSYPSDKAYCRISGYVAHDFDVSPALTAPAMGEVTVSGSWRGVFDVVNAQTWSDLNGARVTVRLIELGAVASTILADEIVLESSFAMAARANVENSFSYRLTGSLRPGGRYRVDLHVALNAVGDINEIDFGKPGTGNMVGYDSIEVCLHQPEGGIGGGTDADLERDLYDGRLMPGLWLPVASGGRLEHARALVATRIAQATSTGAAGVNPRVAGLRMRMVDDAIASGDYQRAAQLLSQALHALTTP